MNYINKISFFGIGRVLWVVTLMILCMASARLHSQQIFEVDGKAKINIMDSSTSATQMVVKLSDGTLAVRDASSLVTIGVNIDSVYTYDNEVVDEPLSLIIKYSNNTYDTLFSVLPPGPRGEDGIGIPQTLSLVSDSLKLSDDGGYVLVDTSNTNELQQISRNGLIVSLSQGGGSYQDSVLDETAVDLMVSNNNYLTSFTEMDGDSTNELQTIERNGLTVSLTGGGSFQDSVLTAEEVDLIVANKGYIKTFTEIDGDVSNELQDIDLFAIISDSLNISLSQDDDTYKVDLSKYLNYSNSQLSQEQVQDSIGTMLEGNTETLIEVSYDDLNNELDFVVEDDLSLYDNSTSKFISVEKDSSTQNELITSVVVLGDSLSITESNSIYKVQIDSSNNNELITYLGIRNDSLGIAEGIVDTTWVDLSGISEGVKQGTDITTFNLRANNEGAVSGLSRGEYSVDLQTSRIVENQVATGEASVIAGGKNNKSKGEYSTISGGISNQALADSTTIGGGANNIIDSLAFGSTISGGADNLINAIYATVGGGMANTASGVESTISGGTENRALSSGSTIGGGLFNKSDSMAVVSGGIYNNAMGVASSISGGEYNRVFGPYSTISGGKTNLVLDSIFGFACTIGGGEYNRIDGADATIGGGAQNVISGFAATIAGGFGNRIDTTQGTIAGGNSNTVMGVLSFIGGGQENQTSSQYTVINGGWFNSIDTLGRGSVIGGGEMNMIKSANSTVAGGVGNSAFSLGSVIGGGQGNVIDSSRAYYATISGGAFNKIDSLADRSVIGGGEGNRTSSKYSIINGGWFNSIDTLGRGSVIGGGEMNIIRSANSTVSGGTGNNTFSLGGVIGGGQGNVIDSSSAYYATISGGAFNKIDSLADRSVIGGGEGNRTSSKYSTINGGWFNSIDTLGRGSVIGGGEMNMIKSANSTVAGGAGNSAFSLGSVIGGGQGNVIDSSRAYYSTISGGAFNTIDSLADRSTIGGGEGNQVLSSGSLIGGGVNNMINGSLSIISGGLGNQTLADFTTISGGDNNLIDSLAIGSTISGGTKNVIKGRYATIPGGRNLIANSYGETVVGYLNDTATVYSIDSIVTTDRLFTIGNGDTITNRSNAMVVLKNGHTGIGNIEPDTTLHVKGGFKYDDGNQGADKVLTSDENGVASWQSVLPQQLATNGDTIFISEGNYIILPGLSYLSDLIPTPQSKLDEGVSPCQVAQDFNSVDSVYGRIFQGGYIYDLDTLTYNMTGVCNGSVMSSDINDGAQVIFDNANSYAENFAFNFFGNWELPSQFDWDKFYINVYDNNLDGRGGPFNGSQGRYWTDNVSGSYYDLFLGSSSPENPENTNSFRISRTFSINP